MLLALLLAFLAGGIAGWFLPRLPWFAPRPQGYSTTAVIQQIQTLAELVTVKYVMEKVQVLENPTWYGQDRVLMVVHGVVKAGVDLQQLRPENLRVEDKRIVLTLPPARITDAYLVDDKTQVIERTTGLLRLFDRDQHLEQTARQQAVDDIARAARRSGIVKEAEERARGQVEWLLRQLGFEVVEFRAP